MSQVLPKTTIYSDYASAATVDAFTNLMLVDRPIFINRLGGCDYDIVIDYLLFPERFKRSLARSLVTEIISFVLQRKSTYQTALETVRNNTGYFDFENLRDNFIRYIEVTRENYAVADAYTYGGKALIEKFERDNFGKDKNFLQEILPNKIVFHYSFIEAIKPFLTSFKTWGEGKKILIVSPFSKSLSFQNDRRNTLIKDYTFPNFQLRTYTSPITYNTPSDTKKTLAIDSNNWHEEYERMNREISSIDFDIALLSCASYASTAGTHIRQMGKKAIYVGGALNVMFNIYGGRYDTPFFNSLVHLETQIEPFENEIIEKLSGGKRWSGEAARAYFGHKRHGK